MKMNCALEFLKEKKYIEWKQFNPSGHLRSFKVFTVKSLVGERFEKELLSLIKKSDEYIYCGVSYDHNYIIAKTEDIKEWMEEILFEEEVDVCFGYEITSDLLNYIRSNGYSLYSRCFDSGSFKIINEKVHKERLKREKDIENKAIKFLKCLNGEVE